MKRLKLLAIQLPKFPVNRAGNATIVCSPNHRIEGKMERLCATLVGTLLKVPAAAARRCLELAWKYTPRGIVLECILLTTPDPDGSALIRPDEVRRIVTVAVKGLEDWARTARNGDYPDVRVGSVPQKQSEGRSVIYLKQEPALAVTALIAELVHAMNSDERYHGASILADRAHCDLAIGMPGRLWIEEVDRTRAIEVRGQVISVHSRNHQAVLLDAQESTGTRRVVLDYSAALKAIGQSPRERLIDAQKYDREMILKVTGHPFVRKDAAGHHDRAKLEVTAVEVVPLKMRRAA